jgi:hypothetical protein
MSGAPPPPTPRAAAVLTRAVLAFPGYEREPPPAAPERERQDFLVEAAFVAELPSAAVLVSLRNDS